MKPLGIPSIRELWVWGGIFLALGALMTAVNANPKILLAVALWLLFGAAMSLLEKVEDK